MTGVRRGRTAAGRRVAAARRASRRARRTGTAQRVSADDQQQRGADRRERRRGRRRQRQLPDVIGVVNRRPQALPRHAVIRTGSELRREHHAAAVQSPTPTTPTSTPRTRPDRPTPGSAPTRTTDVTRANATAHHCPRSSSHATGQEQQHRVVVPQDRRQQLARDHRDEVRGRGGQPERREHDGAERQRHRHPLDRRSRPRATRPGRYATAPGVTLWGVVIGSATRPTSRAKSVQACGPASSVASSREHERARSRPRRPPPSAGSAAPTRG